MGCLICESKELQTQWRPVHCSLAANTKAPLSLAVLVVEISPEPEYERQDPQALLSLLLTVRNLCCPDSSG